MIFKFENDLHENDALFQHTKIRFQKSSFSVHIERKREKRDVEHPTPIFQTNLRGQENNIKKKIYI